MTPSNPTQASHEQTEQRVEYLRNLKYKGVIKSSIKAFVSVGEFESINIEAVTNRIFEQTLQVMDARERAHLEAAKREALEQAETRLRKIGTEQARQAMRTLLTAINNGTNAKKFIEGYLEMDARLSPTNNQPAEEGK